jgi:tetratricopeptide (TPR) repeat protein
LTVERRDTARALALRVRVLAAQGDLATAEQELERLSQGFPDAADLVPEARLDLADASAQAGQGRAAVEHYRLAAREAAAPTLRARAAYAEGLLLSKVGRLQEALPLMQEAVRQDATSEWAAQALYKIGVIASGDGSHAQAQEAFARLWSDHPAHPLAADAMRADAVELRALARYDRAIVVSHQFLERFPDAPEAAVVLSDIAYCHHEMGQHELAIAAYRKVLPLLDEEEQAHAHFWMADSLEQLGRFDEAAAAFLKIPYLFPRQAQLAVTAQLRAGDAYRRMGRAGAARSLYEKVVSSQGPESQWGREARRRLDELAAAGGSGS